MQKNQDKQKFLITFDTKKLLPAQRRLICSLMAVTQELLNSKKEADFFTHSAELMRLCASLIQQAHFTEDLKNHGEDIPYIQQVLEYSIDALQEHMSLSTIVSYDH